MPEPLLHIRHLELINEAGKLVSDFSLEIFPDNFKVFYEGWHEDFEDEDEALNCFAFGLSNECRLKQFSKNGEAYKWTLEYKDGEDWIADSTVSLFNISFWKSTTIEYLQNDLIK